jgi:hypothetical protein
VLVGPHELERLEPDVGAFGSVVVRTAEQIVARVAPVLIEYRDETEAGSAEIETMLSTYRTSYSQPKSVHDFMDQAVCDLGGRPNVISSG